MSFAGGRASDYQDICSHHVDPHPHPSYSIILYITVWKHWNGNVVILTKFSQLSRQWKCRQSDLISDLMPQPQNDGQGCTFLTYTGNQELSCCQLCRHCRQRRLSPWRPAVSPMMRNSVLWWLSVFRLCWKISSHGALTSIDQLFYFYWCMWNIYIWM